MASHKSMADVFESLARAHDERGQPQNAAGARRAAERAREATLRAAYREHATGETGDEDIVPEVRS